MLSKEELLRCRRVCVWCGKSRANEMCKDELVSW
jgi:hypothetical protein